MSGARLDAIKALLAEHGQDHLLQFWDRLNEKDRCQLLADIEYVDIPRCVAIFSAVMQPSFSDKENVDGLVEPVPAEHFGSLARTTSERLLAYRKAGLEAIAKGEVAALLLAGGQGTRLGVPYPKGMYDVGLPSKKSLYALQGERLKKLESLAAKEAGKEIKGIPWYIMASEHTKAPTLDYFAKHSFFGLQKKNLIVFEQNLMPAFSFDGKIVLEKMNRLALSPDGNGGLYHVLLKRGILDDMAERGVKFIHVYCVDNILVKVADPIFIGFCLSKNAECGAKVVEKSSPSEPVGVVCKVRDRYKVVEYSEISSETAQRREPDGRLTFSAGNICNHFFTLDFLNKVCRKEALKYHIAKKKIPSVNSEGVTEKPAEPNGIKLEMFVFDVFEQADAFAVWEVPRRDEFSPLKNADGADSDTPTTCRRHLFALHRRYVERAGGTLVDEKGELVAPPASSIEVVCEISPLVSYDGEDLEGIVKNKKLIVPCHLSTLASA